MKAIYKRELLSYLRSPIGYVFIGIFLLMSGYFFTEINLSYQVDDISYMFSSQSFPSISFVMLFIIPLLTMRLIAEERHSKTDQLLLTSPVSPASIVLGKFLAATTIMLISLCLMSVYAIILCIFGEPAIGPMITLFLGFLLMSASLIALGIFASSITENQIVAAVVGFAVLLLTWLIGLLSVNPIIENLSVLNRFEEFVEGQMSLSSILYLLTFSAVFLALATFKFSVCKRTKKLPLYCGIFAIIVALNFVPWNISWDLTQNKLFSLSSETKSELSNLNKDVNIFVFADRQSQDRMVNSVANKYAASSKYIKTKKIDLSTNTELAEKYTTDDSEIESGNVVVECGDKFKTLTIYDMYGSTNYFYIDIFDAENAIISAINEVTTEDQTIEESEQSSEEGIDLSEGIDSEDIIDSENEVAFENEEYEESEESGENRVTDPKYLLPGMITLSKSQLAICVLSVLIVLPGAVLIMGLVVWLKRRKK